MSKADDAREERILLPGQQAQLLGHQQAREEILRAFAAGRAHHGWLISGPSGVGKATLAWHVARLLLAFPGAGLAQAPAQGIGPEHPVFQQMAAGAHPDFFLLRRQRDRARRLRAGIVVEDARALGHFLSLKSASGGRRVVIVDVADEMNASAANAILKLLEEPPPDTHFFLLAHAPGRLLPTIRSRCLQVALSPLAEEEVSRALRSGAAAPLEGVDDALLHTAVAMSGGSAGRALDLVMSKALPLWREVEPALARGGQALWRAAMRAGQALSGADARDDLALFLELLRGWGRQRLRQAAMSGDAAAAARWAEALATLEERQRALEALNLDRRQLLEAMLRRLAEVNQKMTSTG